ncbi:hypothetical protein V5P93_006837 [Actinokineospora auranticolor]|uniref:Mce-associated membrane protein n=1 Tax=Actinokineospora auranticolor TaxID=155976 RepID=A0A2S6GWE8_9PSEU|nr:hypothetical protein [Actinokineospora auranticolor]PPK69516.1 Mce-associated membrane protein [Actinokineospora auranticolor]
MPTPPRRRPAGPPARRPRVAGIRRPAGPGNPNTPEAADPTGAPEAPDTVATPEPAPQPFPRADEPVEPDLEPAAVEPRAEQEEMVSTDGVIGAEPVDGLGDQVEPVDEEPARRPSPRPSGKHRARSEPYPDTSGPERAGRAPRYGATAERSRSRGINTAIALGVLALGLAGLALWFKGEADSLTAGVDSGNRAITDTAATSEVIGKLTVAVERTLSYDYANLDASANAVRDTLVGRAVCEYDSILGELRKLAPEKKIVLTTKVRNLGVQRLDGDRVDALVFIDQTTTHAADGATTGSAAMFGLRAERVGGAWKITDVDFLGQPLADGKAPATC